MAKKITVADYAAHRGCSRVAVHKAIKDGRLVKSVSKDAKGHVLVDKDLADREWAANTDTTRAPADRPEPKASPATEAPNVVAFAPPAAGARPGRRRAPVAGDLDPEQMALELKAAKLQLAHYQAELKRVAFEKETGQLVPIDQVKATVANEYTAVRQRLLSIPTRLAREVALVENVDQVRTMLEAAIVDALTELAADQGAEPPAPPAEE